MPELPEAENIGRALRREMTGRTITKVEVFTPAMRTPLLPLKDAELPGHRFTAIRRRGRYLLADLDDNRTILMHFGMSGVVRVEPVSIPRRKHEHLFLYLDDGRAFRFECTRRFSLCEVHTLPCPGGMPECLAGLGVEPLESNFTPEYLYARSRKVQCCAKNFLMDNRIVVGIGNIYATEALFDAGVDPRKAAGKLTRCQCEKLVQSSIKILHAAIAAGGSTIADFRNVDGSEGKFARELKIYGKAGSPCPRCGKILKSVKLGGRTSAFCPGCQK